MIPSGAASVHHENTGISLLVTNKANRKLLENWLEAWHYPVVSHEGCLREGRSWVLIAVDGPALETYRREISLLKEKDPTFLPVLLVTTRKDVQMVTSSLWKVVDELILAPIEKAELHCRVEVLLRARDYSSRMQKNYYALAENNPAGILIVRDERIEYANRRVLEQTGYAAEHLLGKRYLDLVSDQDRDKLREYYQGVLSGAYVPPFLEAAVPTPAGRRFVEIYAAPMEYRGEPAMLVLAVDVTARKHLEEQLLQAQKMESIGTLAGGVAHDFNNYLTVIVGYSELLLQKMEKGDPRRKLISEMRVAGERAASVAQQLLIFSRRQTIEFTSTELNVVLQNLEKMLRRFIGEDVELETKYAADLYPVQADQGLVEQVLMNLAVNARDAMPEGGRLAITTENVHCDEQYCRAVPGARPGSYACITIEDTGKGMSAETTRRIFEPFFTTKESCTGLGLSVAYGILEKHGGWIHVYSEPGSGTRFTLYFPSSGTENGKEHREHRDLPLPAGRGERVLLVEDEPHVRRFSSRLLREHGYRVVEARNKKEALDLFQQQNGAFDLVFSDVVLPDTTGLALVEELRTRKPGIRVLLTSGYLDKKSQWPAIKELGLHYIRKPFSMHSLLTVMRDALR
jgi:PAS domain S-box-containing protein